MESLGQLSLLDNQPRYIIDACSLLAQKAERTHNRRIHKTLWANIEKLLEGGEIVVLSEVVDEIQYGADEVSEWLKKQKYRRIALEKSIQDEARELLKTVSDIIDFKTCKSSADIFIIAAAKKYGLVVITEENKLRPKKIPMVCERVGVKCLNINELCTAENWSF